LPSGWDGALSLWGRGMTTPAQRFAKIFAVFMDSRAEESRLPFH